MPIRMKTLLLGLSVAVIVGLAWGSSFAQSMGPAALAARQHIKDKVIAAMEDGKISTAERIEIFAKAKEILKPEEYAGLMCTIERISPSESVTHSNTSSSRAAAKGAGAKQSNKVASAEIVKKPNSTASNMMSQGPSSNPSTANHLVRLPYIDEVQLQTPLMGKMLPRNTYVKPPEMDVAAQADKLAARLPNFFNVYFDFEPAPTQSKQPSNLAKQNKPKATLAAKEKSPTQVASATKKEKPSAQVVSAKKQVKQKTHVELSKNSPVTNAQAAIQGPAALKPQLDSPRNPPVTNEQAKIQEPGTLWNKAERPVTARRYADYSVPVLTTPGAAFLSADKKNSAVKVTYDQPLAPDPDAYLSRK